MHDLDPKTRALLRGAAGRAATRSLDPSPVMANRARYAALHALLAEAAAQFVCYGLDAWTPMANQPAFSYRDRGTLTVQVKPEMPNDEVRGLLRESSDGGGAVRAVEVELATLAWDPGLGRLVPADPEDRRSALDVLLIGLLRALRLT